MGSDTERKTLRSFSDLVLTGPGGARVTLVPGNVFIFHPLRRQLAILESSAPMAAALHWRRLLSPSSSDSDKIQVDFLSDAEDFMKLMEMIAATHGLGVETVPWGAGWLAAVLVRI